MKSFRFLLALALAGFFTATLVRATDDKPQSEEKTCAAPKDKDGKACGMDKDKEKGCCCAGKKGDKDAAKDTADSKEPKK